MNNRNFIMSGLAGIVLLTGSAVVASAQDRRHDHQTQQGQSRQTPSEPVQRQSQPRTDVQSPPVQRRVDTGQQRGDSNNRWRNQPGQRPDQRNAGNGQQQNGNFERERNDRERQQQLERQREQQRADVQCDNRTNNDRSFRNDRGRDQQLAIERQREQERIERERREHLNNRNWNDRNSRNNGSGFFNNRYQHYRVYRNGTYFQTDYNGVGMLQRAINSGYAQGIQAGRADRYNRHGYDFQDADDFRSGMYGYSGSYVDSSQYSYYFREGFQRGYEDGYYGRYSYGSYENGNYSVLDRILGALLNVQGY